MIYALLKRIFIINWPRKLTALFSAIIIWFLVNQSISSTKTFNDIPIRVVMLPPNKTVLGLLPNGLLNKRTSLQLVGPKSVLEGISSSDLEILIHAEGKKESWVAKIDKRNLSFLSGDEEAKKKIIHVEGEELFIKLSNLETEEIPLTITAPVGDSPLGFQFIDIWPKQLLQRVSGPEEEIEALKQNGLHVTFDLDRITKEELEVLKSTETSSKTDEVSFFIPAGWKTVFLPFLECETPFNDPRSKYLRIDFLKKEQIPLGIELPIICFFPVKYSKVINPKDIVFAHSPLIEEKNGLILFKKPLFAQNVSRAFLDCVKENMALVIVFSPHGPLNATIELIDLEELEEKFVHAKLREKKEEMTTFSKYNEEALKRRFKSYVESLAFYMEDGKPLSLHVRLEGVHLFVDNGT